MSVTRFEITHGKLGFRAWFRSFTLFVALIHLAHAAPLRGLDFSFIVTNSTLVITGYSGLGGVVTIPASINGLPVTSIGPGALARIPFTSLTVPDTVTTIGESAFADCLVLTNITLGKNLTTISDSAFASCSSLPRLSIPASVTSIGKRMFLLCSVLTTIDVDPLNPTYSSIDGLLCDKSGSSLIAFPPGRSGSYTIPPGLSAIETNSFESCLQLKEVTVGSNITNIAESAFNLCQNLANLNITNGLKNIGRFAFYSCTSLTNISIPDSVIELGASAFYGCTSLASARIGNGLTTIEDSEFVDCLHLTSVTFGNSITNIGQKAFYDCTLLDNVIFPNSLQTIQSYAFYSCRLSSLTIPDGVFGIEPFAFSMDANLGSVKLGTAITNVEDGVFANCFQLRNVLLSESVERIGAGVFSSCRALGSIDLPDTVVEIETNAFSDCNLTNITLGPHLSDIGPSAFENCQLVTLALPETVTNIGDYAFSQCPLVSMKLGTGLKTIGPSAFSGCLNIPAVTIPASVESIGFKAFAFCNNLTNISVDSANAHFSSLDGVLFDKLETGLISYPAGKVGSFFVPSGVTNVEDFAFAWCAELTNLFFRGDAPVIGSDQFFNAPNLVIYYLPKAAGWGPSIAGKDPLPWDPEVRTDDGTFGLVSNQISFNITGSSNLWIVVEGTTNLFAPVWSPLATNTLSSGLFNFSDPEWTNYATRFYRFRSP